MVVAVDSNSPAYSRDLFKTWDTSKQRPPQLRRIYGLTIMIPISVSGTCDTRETVLKRDGTNVVTDSSCKATSGNWVSPYDGVPTTLASDLDIVSVCKAKTRRPCANNHTLQDHLVPLKEVSII